MDNNKALIRFSKSKDVSCRLVLFPHAGGGAAAYFKLAKCMPDWLEVVAVVPPGREARIREPFAETISDMARGAVDALAQLPARPQAFFGHSMGAMLAFETAHMLAEGEQNRMPRHLFLSGRRAHGSSSGETPLSHLPSRDFVQAISNRYGGIPQQVLADRELLDLFLPVIRADIAAIERYVCPPREPLDVSLTLVGGISDPQCTDQAWEGWKQCSVKEVEYLRFAGDHFFLHSRTEELAIALAQRIRLLGSTQ